ncbi:MAG: Competence protein ComEC [Candidatus Magasanikbacteria bacterium GW2011_GWC2_37_14]|uniref:Competence protein ComEC n=1 Tax=Candidatus Magasanikbacteria bacterium GW2011_GWC2_37_14 TaxID=1619046 RepID=A0A0G0GAW6_9BACT|nr:MAG: Competence protein ComEC [Candidatus Magasanikbacteria bacterium GW2011_GWC2_37_14]
MLAEVINSKSKTFLMFCFCFLIGISIASIIYQSINLIYFYIILFIFLFFLIIFWTNKKVVFIVFCLFVIFLGVFRYELKLFVNKNHLINFVGQSLAFQGIVIAEPDIRQDGVRYILETQNFASLYGKIYLKQNLYPRYNYGDILKLHCDLEKPEELDSGFRYDMYLAVKGVRVVCKNPEVHKIGENAGNKFLQIIFVGKKLVAEKINKLWPEPSASLVAGLLYGYRGGVGDLSEAFNRTGLTHIIAISGYNISIIVAILSIFFTYLLIPRKKAFWLIIIGLLIFVIFVGFAGSVLRAVVMGGLVLIAGQIGRLSKITNVVVFTVVLLCLFNPLILFWDAGFQLSLAATLGLVYLTPVIVSFMNKIVMLNPEINSGQVPFQHLSYLQKILKPFGVSSGRMQVQDDKIISFLKDSFVSTLSAIIATLPLILYYFGRFSIVAPIVNILVLWLVPFLMFFSFVAVFLSFIYWPLAQFVAFISYLGLKYVIIVITWFASFKFAAVEMSISWWVVILMYLIIIWLKLKF